MTVCERDPRTDRHRELEHCDGPSGRVALGQEPDLDLAIVIVSSVVALVCGTSSRASGKVI